MQYYLITFKIFSYGFINIFECCFFVKKPLLVKPKKIAGGELSEVEKRREGNCLGWEKAGGELFRVE